MKIYQVDHRKPNGELIDYDMIKAKNLTAATQQVATKAGWKNPQIITARINGKTVLTVSDNPRVAYYEVSTATTGY